MNLLLLALGLASLWLRQPQAAFNPTVRVWLTGYQQAPLYLRCETTWRAISAQQSVDLAPFQTVVVERSGEALALRVGEQVFIAPEWRFESDTPIRLSRVEGQVGRAYRPTLTVSVRNGRLQAVNVLPLEEYLLGVVPLEMPPSFPEEALRAQAIAARTWTVRNRHKHEQAGFDVCDGTHCQVYGGYDAERETTSRAVRETAGLILLQSDMPIDATYTADCGGQPVIQGAPPLPFADRDPSGKDYCDANPQHCWRIEFAFEQVWQRATGQESPANIAKQRVGVQIEQVDPSGRALAVLLRCGEQARLVSAAQLRLRLGLPSTLFQVRLEQDRRVVFEGKGAGHGWGLCQWGAAGRARAGQTAEQILKAYYPEATLAPLSEAIWEWRSKRRNSSKPMRR